VTPVIALLDLLGAVAFFAASAVAVRLFRSRPLFRNYWLIWIVAVGHFGLWAVAESVEWLGVAPAFFDSLLQVLLLTVGLTALLHIALYDNTGSEDLLRRFEVSEARNRKLIEHYPAGAVVLFDGRLRALLAGGEDLLGLDAEPASVEGDALPEALPEGLASELAALCRDGLDEETASLEVSTDGSTYRVRALPVGDAADAERKGMLVVQDVTGMKRREETLREQRDELETLDRINAVIRDIDRALVGSRTREEIAQAVADRLAADDPYRSALVASLGGDDRLDPVAWSGTDDVGAVPTYVGPDATGAGARAIASGELQVVTDTGSDGADPWRASARERDASAVAVIPVRHGDRTYGIIAVYADRADAFDDRERAVLDQFGRTVGYAVTAVERRERADLLTALHRATRDLLHAETREAVGDVVVEAGTGLLDVEIGVYLYDPDGHRLRAAAASDSALEFFGDSPACGGDAESVIWRTFAGGERAVFDDVRNAESLADPDTDARGAMFLPLGDHGVLVAGSTDVGAFDERNRQLIELLAATTEAAFDRVESEADLRRRESELRERNRALGHLRRVNDVIRDVDQALLGATSRAEVEQSVCDRLTATDRFAFAWIGGLRSDEGDVRARAWSGDGVGYLDAVTFDPEEDFPEPAARTLASKKPTTVAALPDRVRRADWVSRGLEYGFGSAVSVPISYRGIDYGALTVYASGPDEFDEMTTAVLSELGETVAYAIDARETKRGLVATSGTELKLRVEEDRSFLNAIAAAADAPVTVVESRPGSGDASQVYFRAENVALADLEGLADRFVAVEEVDALTDRDDETLFRATVVGSTLWDDVVEVGAIPREIEATTDGTTLVVSLLPHVDAAEFVERLRERYRGVDLLARRERRPATRTRNTFLDEYESRVTDRQLEVLREAYESGYFESPRESSGQDIADSLGVTQPTVNHHLRVSQRRLLSLLFGERDGNERVTID
jgi:predicted DNA binding protein/putative methionine-R-sulfoxide reductase with GAF domain